MEEENVGDEMDQEESAELDDENAFECSEHNKDAIHEVSFISKFKECKLKVN